MKLNSLALSLCRVPAFGANDELATVWPTLKTNIKAASPSFYEQIAKVAANEIDTMPEKIKFTVWKYFNRAKYRATPFANFASYTVVPISRETDRLQIAAQMQSHLFIDWQAKEQLNSGFKLNLRKSNWLFSNTSAYQIDTEIRYLRLKDGTFELASVNTFSELISLINYCNIKRNKATVYHFMQTEHKLDKKQCENLILQLLDLQLLHTDQTANITGEDYFTRLKLPINNEHYILAERKLLNGGLEASKSEAIAEALQFMAKQLPKSQNKDLQNFKSAFLKKFEHQQVSLAILMDPERGIGYGNLIQYEQPDELIEQLKNWSSQEGEHVFPSIQYSEMHQFLINGLMEQGDIALEKFETTITKPNALPNTLSVICHFYKGNPVIHHAGGCTANTLLGRFTLGNETLAAHCKEIAEIEQNANPNVLFFDIAYQAETRIDNVNRRKNCYAYELPILTWSCQAEPLDFNDIMVTVQANEIILFSKKLGKRLIPRLASAYNYSRSDLAAYRFLCDLQHQSIQSNLTFDIQTYLPGIKHYPRVTYKKVILSPAKWLIPESIYQAKNKSQNDSLAELVLWLKAQNITFLVKTGIADQTLCFDPNSTTDLIALLHHCKQQDSRPLYLIEALIDENDYLTDENGKKYVAEFIVNYYHDSQIYNSITSQKALSIADKASIPTHYLAGSEWLYFEIYVNSSKSNTLLCNEICWLLKTHKSDISQWFFIRYHENGKHLRLRLKIRDLSKRSQIIDYVNLLLTTPMLKGIVSDVSIKTYYPEIARYGTTRITNVEQFFCLDSKYVLSLLAKTLQTNLLYQVSVQFFNRITGVCFPLFSERLAFAKHMAESFATEFNIHQLGFKKINQLYAAIQQDKNLIAIQNESYLKQLENSACAIFMLCTASEKPKMLADLIHMHVNRLFNNDQRLHEAICYQFLYKQLLTEARLAVQAEHQASA